MSHTQQRITVVTMLSQDMQSALTALDKAIRLPTEVNTEVADEAQLTTHVR